MTIWPHHFTGDLATFTIQGSSHSKFQGSEHQRFESLFGACNFFRRHVRNFTFSSAPLTGLLKKNARFVWSEKEESLIEEIKQKLLSSTPLGVPRSTGEMVIVTDASDLGGWHPPPMASSRSLTGSRRFFHPRHDQGWYDLPQLPIYLSIGPSWLLELEVVFDKITVLYL